MIRYRLVAAILVTLGGIGGCGGLSDSEIKVRCDQERAAKMQSCVDEDAYAQCMSCYEECGDSCRAKGLCPEKYSCVQ